MIRGNVIAPPGQEGWTRHQEKYREASLDGADGVVVQDPQKCFEPEPPPRLRRFGCSAFSSYWRSHPSWPGGAITRSANYVNALLTQEGAALRNSSGYSHE